MSVVWLVAPNDDGATAQRSPQLQGRRPPEREVNHRHEHLAAHNRMLGLGRPSLRTRPSLLHLIDNGAQAVSPVHSESSSVASPSELEGDRHRSPSPAPLLNLEPPHSNESPSASPTPSTEQAVKMPPKDTQEESQHGSVFSVSGPVIVAENMIGCAMYELVGLRCGVT